MRRGIFARKGQEPRINGKTTSKRGISARLASKKAKKPPTLSKLKKLADAAFSQYIRRKYADPSGLVKSFTGNEIMPWQRAHCGHYISRSCLALRWHPDNARPQSPAENIWKHGNPIEFRENLVKEIGEKRVKELEAARHTITKLTRPYLEEVIEHYKNHE